MISRIPRTIGLYLFLGGLGNMLVARSPSIFRVENTYQESRAGWAIFDATGKKLQINHVGGEEKLIERNGRQFS